MTYSLTFPVGNASLTITADNPAALVGEFEAVKGDGGMLISEVKAAAANPFVQLAVSEQAQETPASSAEAVADPWADDASSTPTAHPSSNPDPWADDPSDAPAGQTSPNGASASANQGITKTTDNFGREFTMGLPEAPSCEHGIKAAKMKAKAKGSGKVYHKWICSKAAGKNWKDKCDLDEFVN